MDTGATDHVHSNVGILDSVCGNCTSYSVLVGDGSKVPVVTSGHAPFPVPNPYRTLHLNDVLITPKIIKNLVSVRKFTRQNKVSIEFGEFGFTVNDYRTRQPLIRCDSNSSLYPVLPATPQAFVFSSQSTWHQRLGHPGDHVLKSLVYDRFISCSNDKNNVICSSCQLGKHVKLPFSLSDSVVSNVFDIIHSDVFTSPISSITGLRYYFIFLHSCVSLASHFFLGP